VTAGGSQGPVVKSLRNAPGLLMPHLAAVDRQGPDDREVGEAARVRQAPPALRGPVDASRIAHGWARATSSVGSYSRNHLLDF
jgi:hypothetical protein